MLSPRRLLGVHGKTDPLVTEGKAEMVKALQDFTAVIDSSGLCLFVALAPNFLYEEIQSLMNAASGAGYSVEELVRIGERIWNLERLFNLKAGFTKADDTLPKRLLEEPGGPKGDVCRLNEMLPEYYQLRGWDENGVPTTDKIVGTWLGIKIVVVIERLYLHRFRRVTESAY